MATILSDLRESGGPRAGPGNGYKVDISGGERIGRVSCEWFSRPDDERYLSLSALYDAVLRRAERATARTVETREVRSEASRDDVESLALILPGRDQLVAPTTGRSASATAWSVRLRAICASCPDRLPASTCSTGYCRIGLSS